jgi:threonine/homoserine efflux transporter RhtA
VLFVVALRHLGTEGTGAYFSLAPFIGAAASIAILAEPLTAGPLVAGALTGAAEPHAHRHVHERLAHAHHHYPDIHHRHPH